MGQIVLELEKAGSWADFGAEDLTHRYLWGPGANNLLVDEAVSDLFDAEENDTLYALPDHLGTVRDLVSYDPIAEETVLRKHTSFDSFGQVVDEAFYDKSGDPIASSHAEAVDQLFMFTGAMRDGDTGLQNHWNRWYDTATGNWISVDPIKDGVNWYGYVGNSPTEYIDSDGLKRAVWITPTGWRGALPFFSTLTWEVDEREEEKLQMLTDTIAIAQELQRVLREQGGDEGDIADLCALEKWALDYKVAIQLWTPPVSFAANGARITFPFSTYEGTDSKGTRLFRAFTQGFHDGKDTILPKDPFAEIATGVVGGPLLKLAGKYFWQMNHFARGRILDRMLGNNVGANFPVIDKFIRGNAISVKSLNTNATTYADVACLRSKVKGYIDKLAGFQGATHGGTTVARQDISRRTLQLVVPGHTEPQRAVLEGLKTYARQNGVDLQIILLP